MKLTKVNRRALLALYYEHRRIWDKRVSYYLTAVRYADRPAERLACALALAQCGIPPHGKWNMEPGPDYGPVRDLLRG